MFVTEGRLFLNSLKERYSPLTAVSENTGKESLFCMPSFTSDSGKDTSLYCHDLLSKSFLIKAVSASDRRGGIGFLLTLFEIYCHDWIKISSIERSCNNFCPLKHK